jgi:4Fe-4S ferredoxin
MLSHSKKKTRMAEEDRISYLMLKKGDEIVFSRESVRDRRTLVFKKDACVGCWFCYDSCPVDAIEKNPIRNRDGDVIQHENIIIDPEKCVLCGICAEVCAFDALKLTIDGKSIKTLAGYPQYAKRYRIDFDKCVPKDAEKREVCRDCEEVCPRGALKCGLIEEGGAVRNTVERDESICIMCTACSRACPQEAITAEKVFQGSIEVDLDKCVGCGVCVGICPSNALSMPKPEIGEKVDTLVIDEDICVYCGACANSCPTQALTVRRDAINYVKEKNTSTLKRRARIFMELLTGEEGK